ncbi:hypothetical protein CALCODRAFT_84489 [Calocera cornea HHB12733]|uniref:Uncharacterized protein n=1 Tax=Calocera cornea HHB12733 TaxID=1353952 RepID=A0A165IMI1_9BASI|nr:hypothetical protein CALCODRAFT_84489 [Calocera cornea HHB12733]
MQGFGGTGFGSAPSGNGNAFGQPSGNALNNTGFGRNPTSAGFGGSTSNAFGNPGPNALGSGSSAPAAAKPTFDPQSIIKSLPVDMRDYIQGAMWPLTSYAVAKFEPNVLEGLDTAPEEVRLEYYKLRNAPGGLQQYEHMWNNAYANARSQYSEDPHRLAAMVAEAERRHRARDAGQPFQSQQPQPASGATTSAFGPGGMGAPPPAQAQGSAFGAGGMGQPQQQNAFGQPQPAQNAFGQPQPAQSAFGSGGSGPAQSTFGRPQPPQAQNAFGQPQPTTNAFGQPQPSLNAFGQPQPVQNAFGQPQQAQSAFGPGGMGPAQSTFGQPQPAQNVFAQPQPQGQNAFGLPPPQGQSAFGQPQPQTAPAFGQAQQPPAFGTEPGTTSAFGPGGAGPPQQPQQPQPSQPAGFGAPTTAPAAGFGQPQTQPQPPSAEPKITVKYRQRPLVPDFINPFPTKEPWVPGPVPSFDPKAGSLLPEQLRTQFKRPTWPETDAARKKVADAWTALPEEFRRECDEIWKADKFEYGKIPGLPPPSEYR